MNQTEQILYPIPLPDFIMKFKDACVEQLVSPIDYAIESINSTSDPILFILLIVLFVQLLRVALIQGKNDSQGLSESQANDMQMMSN